MPSRRPKLPQGMQWYTLHYTTFNYNATFRSFPCKEQYTFAGPDIHENNSETILYIVKRVYIIRNARLRIGIEILPNYITNSQDARVEFSEE